MVIKNIIVLSEYTREKQIPFKCQGVLGSLILGYIQGRWLEWSITILYFILNTMIPVLVTIACNAVMLFAVSNL